MKKSLTRTFRIKDLRMVKVNGLITLGGDARAIEPPFREHM